MQKIFFKARSKEKNEWVEGFYVESYDTFGNKEYYIFSSDKNGGFKQTEINPTTLCRYTGYVDKNQHKIWENDKIDFEGYCGYVKFENAQYIIKWEEGVYFRDDFFFWVTERFNDIEVIEKKEG